MVAGALPDSLLFDAAFESANLRRAVQVGKHAYDLVLSCDCNTRGHTQWFLYRVRNMRAGQEYSLNIINMMKPDSLFCSGLTLASPNPNPSPRLTLLLRPNPS